MQYIALNATTIIPAEEGNRLVADAEFSRGAEETQPQGILHARFYHGIKTLEADFQYSVLIEGWAEENDETGWTGWKRITAWTGAAAASWGLVFACIALVRAVL